MAKEVKFGTEVLVAEGSLSCLVRIEEWEKLFSLAAGHTVTATAPGRYKEMASKALRLRLLSKAPFPRLTWQSLQVQLDELGFKLGTTRRLARRSVRSATGSAATSCWTHLPWAW